MSQFTPDAVDTVVDDIKKALAEVGEKHNLTININGRVSYGDDNFRCKIEALKREGMLEASTEFEKFRKNLVRYGNSYGLDPEDYNKVITTSGKHYRLIGINTRSRKRPVIFKEVGTNGEGHNTGTTELWQRYSDSAVTMEEHLAKNK